MIQTKWRISHAQGFLSLGMVAEAAAELDQLPPADRDALAVLSLRVAILQLQEDWPALTAAAAEFTRRAPEEPGAWITWAYGTRRARSLVEAQRILLEAERRHPAEPTIQFNLGCYACQLGDLQEARRRVDQAIALDKEFATAAATDPDLAPLRDQP